MNELPRPGDEAAPTAARHVDALSDRFEGAWLAGQRPCINEYLGEAPEPQRPDLFRELLRLDVYYRRQKLEEPTEGDYCQRFPEYTDLIHAVFHEEVRSVQTDDTASFPEEDPWARLNLAAEAAFTVRYELLGGEAGRGGMGIIYPARHKHLKRKVAVKVMRPGAASERFLREARLSAKIRSPYVVTVHDCDVLPGGFPVLVMEWVEGRDLRKLIQERGGALAEDETLPWMRHTCEGMLAAAEQGIIHRDLKPSNLLIDSRGCARVADFGLARERALSANLTQTGGMMGTPYYMAPEQAEDPHGVDSRADIYSFGATFYHALTGNPPFQGVTSFAILYKHKTEPLISPRSRNPALSERTSDVLERCLAKAPSDRFSSFAEVLAQLQPGPGLSSPWTVSDDAELPTYWARYQSRKEAYLSERQVLNPDLDTYRFPRDQVLKIVRGDIVSQRVDALVSSDTCFLTMDGGVSAAIRGAAGETIEAEAQLQAPVRAGRVAVTSAGLLPARLVFHAVTIGLVKDQVVCPSRDLIAEIMASCFYHADSHDVRSIAFPLLGTGAQQFPRDICLDIMFQFLARTFLRGLTSVVDARIVLFDQGGELTPSRTL